MTRTFDEPDPELSDAAEIRELGDYLDRSMTPERREAFRQRLLDDPAFFRRVGPIMGIWYRRTPLPAEQAVLDDLRARLAAARAQQARRERRTAIVRRFRPTMPVITATLLAAAVLSFLYIGTPGNRTAPSFVHRPAVAQLPQAPTKKPAATPDLNTATPKRVAQVKTPAPAITTVPVVPATAVDSVIPVDSGFVVLDSAAERVIAAMVDAAKSLMGYTPTGVPSRDSAMAAIDSAYKDPIGGLVDKTGVTSALKSGTTKSSWWQKLIQWFRGKHGTPAGGPGG